MATEPTTLNGILHYPSETPYVYPPAITQDELNAQRQAQITFSPIYHHQPPENGNVEQSHAPGPHVVSPSWIDGFRLNRLRHLLILTALRLRRVLMFELPSQYRSRITHLGHKASSLEELLQPDFDGVELQGQLNRSPLTGYQLKLAIQKKERLNRAWEGFIDSLLKEWKYCNIIFALILSAIMPMLQIDRAIGFAAVRIVALMALLLSLGGIILATMLSLYFSKMRTFNDKAFQWTKVIAPKDHEGQYLNIWVIMALPIVTLVWSIILFMASIVAFSYATCHKKVEFVLYANLIFFIVLVLLWVANKVHSYKIEAAASFQFLELPSADISQRGESTTPASRLGVLPELSPGPAQPIHASDYHVAVFVPRHDRRSSNSDSPRMGHSSSLSTQLYRPPFSQVVQVTNTGSISSAMEGISPQQTREEGRPHPLSKQSTLNSVGSTGPGPGPSVREVGEAAGMASMDRILHSEPESTIRYDIQVISESNQEAASINSNRYQMGQAE